MAHHLKKIYTRAHGRCQQPPPPPTHTHIQQVRLQISFAASAALNFHLHPILQCPHTAKISRAHGLAQGLPNQIIFFDSILYSDVFTFSMSQSRLLVLSIFCSIAYCIFYVISMHAVHVAPAKRTCTSQYQDTYTMV